MILPVVLFSHGFRMKSGSLWTGVILHASHNLFIQAILTPLTIDNGKTMYYIDEFELAYLLQLQ